MQDNAFHARKRKNECAKFRYTRVHVFALCARVCPQIFTKIYLVVHYSVMSLSLKFHKDRISVEEIFVKLSGAGLFGCYCR